MKNFNLWRRAAYATLRRPTRSLILLLIMATIFTALLAQGGIRDTMGQMRQSISRTIGAGFSVAATDEKLTISQVDKIGSLPGVAKHCYESSVMAQVKGANPVSGISSIKLDPAFSGQLTLTGTTDSGMNPVFQAKIFRVEQGSHILQGQAGSLIHQEFANQNGLKLGMNLVLTQSGNEVSVPITGIFSGKKDNPSGLESEAAENQIFASLATVEKLTGEQTISTARYLTISSEQLAPTLKKAEQIAPQLAFENNASQFNSVLDSIATVDGLLNMLLMGVCITGLLVLGLVLIFWVRGRIHEIGILISLGKTKLNIVSQLAIELGILGVTAAGVALIISKILTGSLAQIVFNNAQTETLVGISVENPSIVASLLGIGSGFLLVYLALAIAVIPIFVRSPKSILSKMS